MALVDQQAFVSTLIHDQGPRLRRYMAARLPNAAADVADLVQEVYLRLLRMPKYETIRNPQAYLFTIAHHVLFEHRMRQASKPDSVEMTDLLAEMECYVEEDPATKQESRQLIQAIDDYLRELPPRAYATFVLHRRFGYTHDEISNLIGVSTPMVKKYLAKAVIHCRKRFEGVR